MELETMQVVVAVATALLGAGVSAYVAVTKQQAERRVRASEAQAASERAETARKNVQLAAQEQVVSHYQSLVEQLQERVDRLEDRVQRVESSAEQREELIRDLRVELAASQRDTQHLAAAVAEKDRQLDELNSMACVLSAGCDNQERP